MQTVRLAFYPFLPGVREAMRENAPDMQDLLEGRLYADIRRRAAGRVMRILGDGVLETPPIRDDSGAVQELMTQALCRMLLVCLGDRIVIGRYAKRDAARVRRAIHTDSENVPDVLDALEVPVESTDDGWRIHFSHWLANAPPRDEAKLVLKTLDGGWVDLHLRDLEMLVEEAWKRRLEKDLLKELQHPAPEDLRKALQPYLDEIGPELVKARETWNTGDFGPVRDEAFPPCIVALFEQMGSGVMVPHHGRFAFASFMGKIGMTGDQILDYMSQLPNFNRDKSEYQIRHISGELGVEQYMTPNCSTMQTNGVCPLERRDEICYSIKNPLGYYRKRLKRLPKKIVDETSKKAEPEEEQAADPVPEASS